MASFGTNPTLIGLDNVLANLNKEIKAVKNRTMAGMIKAAIHIRQDMDRTPPLIPLDTGNLRGSWFIKPIPVGIPGFENPVVEIGFTANYAFAVHEAVGRNFRRPDSGAKFFEAALNRNTAKIVGIIAEEAAFK
jgi:hypothetical protein